jgi:hypothetical protein
MEACSWLVSVEVGVEMQINAGVGEADAGAVTARYLGMRL